MYDAFMSYSHASDARLAPALQRALHRFARPWFKSRQVNAICAKRNAPNLAHRPRKRFPDELPRWHIPFVHALPALANADDTFAVGTEGYARDAACVAPNWSTDLFCSMHVPQPQCAIS